MITEISAQTLPKLTPIIKPWVSQLLRNKGLLNEILEKYGSPVNIHNKGEFHENCRAFQEVGENLGVDLGIFFARKANKCKTFVSEAKAANIGVDTASYQELADCIEVGLPSDKIVLTAAIKSRKLLELAVNNEVLVVLDNLDELELLQSTCKKLGKSCKIGLRVSGFLFEDTLPTRFGICLQEAKVLLLEEFTPNGKFRLLNFQGFHFHINGYSIQQRATALSQTIQLADQLRAEGIECQFIDIGGGYLVNYLESADEWNEFHQELNKAILGKRKPITYRNDPLGMFLHKGEIFGSPKVYPYYNEHPKGIFLQGILESKFDSDTKLHEALSSRHIQLRIEPGRSLLDQTGITISEVMFRKKTSQGHRFIGLGMNRTQLRSSSEDFLLDPIFISNADSQNPEPVEGYLVGAYCLEQELILKRKMEFASLPEVGDLVCFVNTAGYMTHFYESQAHLLDLAKNLFFEDEENFEGVFADKY
jgi:diaminopimelate decarboxylase